MYELATNSRRRVLWVLDPVLIGYGIYLIARVWRYLINYLDLDKVSKYDK